LTLRSQQPQGIEQEIWGALIAYNLVRLEMAKAAIVAKVEPTDLNFARAAFYATRDGCGRRHGTGKKTCPPDTTARPDVVCGRRKTTRASKPPFRESTPHTSHRPVSKKIN